MYVFDWKRTESKWWEKVREGRGREARAGSRRRASVDRSLMGQGLAVESFERRMINSIIIEKSQVRQPGAVYKGGNGE